MAQGKLLDTGIVLGPGKVPGSAVVLSGYSDMTEGIDLGAGLEPTAKLCGVTMETVVVQGGNTVLTSVGPKVCTVTVPGEGGVELTPSESSST